MGYERNNQNAGSQGEYFGARDPADTDHLRERRPDGRYSSAGDYAAAGLYGDNERGASQNRYGGRDDNRGGYSDGSYGQRAPYGGDRDAQSRNYGGQNEPYRGSYAHDGHRWEDDARDGARSRTPEDRGASSYRQQGDRSRNQGYGVQRYGNQGYGRAPQGYDYEDRGFFARAGDEVRSWFGDDEAERRREFDSRYDERQYGANSYGRDDDYHQWRKGQIDALDRDYHEYRSENRSKFANEFGSWRTDRQTQRGALSKVSEHMDVVGSDGEHIGTVDKVRGDRILLTKSDLDAGGRHHSIPSRWIDTVDDKVNVRKTAEEAKAHWRDEENNQAFFGDGQTGDRGRDVSGNGAHILNRSFSGTY